MLRSWQLPTRRPGFSSWVTLHAPQQSRAECPLPAGCRRGSFFVQALLSRVCPRRAGRTTLSRSVRVGVVRSPWALRWRGEREAVGTRGRDEESEPTADATRSSRAAAQVRSSVDRLGPRWPLPPPRRSIAAASAGTNVWVVRSPEVESVRALGRGDDCRRTYRVRSARTTETGASGYPTRQCPDVKSDLRPRGSRRHRFFFF